MSTSVCTILNMPDEILVQIISYFNARKRLALANTCTRFNNLVFGDRELLRNLDFSKNGRLTTATDILQYFDQESTCKFVRKVNIKNVICMKPGDMLNNSIGKATNLVDVNIHGLEFKDIEQMRNFLAPLVHIKRLTIEWPDLETDNDATHLKVLKNTLSKLIYLSVDVFKCSTKFLCILLLCQELEELHIQAERRCEPDLEYVELFNEYGLLNLKIFCFHGLQPSEYTIEPVFAMLSDFPGWTQFQLIDEPDGHYFEKNLEVCEELRNKELMRSVLYHYNPNIEFLQTFTSESLLAEVIRITHDDAPATFCCLTSLPYPVPGRWPCCLLKIDEAKQLLKDPEYQISFLKFKHDIQPDCDAHLVVSAFPNLTKLSICNIVTGRASKKKHFKRRLTRTGSTKSEEPDDPTNQDTSFQMLIENTLNLRDLTIHSKGLEEDFAESWDFDSYDLIPRWKNLTALRLVNLGVKDGDFLVEIGKQCSNLETIYLFNLWDLDNYGNSCYLDGLSQMLSHCLNLREFYIRDTYIDDMPQLLTALSEDEKLRTVHIETFSQTCESADLIMFIQLLLYSCTKLTTLVFIMEESTMNGRTSEYDDLEPPLLRLIAELDRPKFQFQGPRPGMPINVHTDASFRLLPHMMD